MSNKHLLRQFSRTEQKALRVAVEGLFEKYRIFTAMGFERREASLISSYQERFHGPTNHITDQTSSIATYNVDEPERRRKFCERIEQAVARLPDIERKIITARYMQDDYIYDIHIYNNLKSDVLDFTICQKTYDKLRATSMCRLALLLGLVVLDEDGNVLMHDVG